MIAAIKAYALQAACLVLLGLLATQTWRLHIEQRDHARLRVTVAEADRFRATAALKHEAATSLKEFGHAAATQENSDAFTTSEPVRAAIARADLARSDRLRTDAERRAGTYRAMAEAGAAACSDLADRHAALDAHVVRGVEVVSGLRSDLVRRDAEVVLLRRQIDVDRALLTDSNPGRPAAGAPESNP
ncbi:hypothetical protein [Pulveribacter sp.]|uniref:hypothetical protein n=1 Tax=Pulveribacter sp. TaxID=2678893 RepID=UPI0028A85C93|nr:hypothetical protein [Pulveribacter sp.]